MSKMHVRVLCRRITWNVAIEHIERLCKSTPTNVHDPDRARIDGLIDNVGPYISALETWSFDYH